MKKSEKSSSNHKRTLCTKFELNKRSAKSTFLNQPFTITPTSKSLLNKQNILITLSDNNREHGRLPLELVCNILSWLPIEDLLRFKSVCKCWRDEINTPYFINSHIRRIKNNNEANSSTSSLVIVFSSKYNILMSIDFHSPENTKVRPITPNISLDNPYLVGSSIGLLCFTHLEYSMSKENQTRSFSLYNPITGASKLIPKLEPLNPNLRNGFGYDCTSGDYKILCLATDQEDFMTTYTCVYSLKNNSWKVNMDEPCPYLCGNIPWSSCMVLSNNALHFIASEKLIAFDLVSERFHEIQLPSDQVISCIQPFELANLRGCLHLVTLNAIWTMKEYGVQQSWTKLFCFSQANYCALFDRTILGQRRIMPYAYSKDGREILVTLATRHNMFFRLDIESREFKKLEISSLPKDWEYWAHSGDAMPWVGSFVYPSFELF
ncbi:F-box/kelch-repeat protein At3g23880-like [Chenopodium quinoa]|uniref:F-box/kelch-repeat protein At3g23880-like n=1 Tax=Chenopodium quinoa TaxID=63459 RepID=UPI000B78607F|nr:F-box/kelch-repeat protein At3g23880-like [Chenopodium quinoa]